MLIILSSLLITALQLNAQHQLAILTSNAEHKLEAKETTLRSNIELHPMFQHETLSLSQYIKQHLQYPEIALENGMEGVVEVTFWVQPDGLISGANVVKSLNAYCDESALKLINEMPKWRPAQQGERKVASRVRIAIQFNMR